MLCDILSKVRDVYIVQLMLPIMFWPLILSVNLKNLPQLLRDPGCTTPFQIYECLTLSIKKTGVTVWNSIVREGKDISDNMFGCE